MLRNGSGHLPTASLSESDDSALACVGASGQFRVDADNSAGTFLDSWRGPSGCPGSQDWLALLNSTSAAAGHSPCSGSGLQPLDILEKELDWGLRQARVWSLGVSGFVTGSRPAASGCDGPSLGVAVLPRTAEKRREMVPNRVIAAGI